MTDPTIPQRVLFPDLGSKPVVATFDREQASSDGGAVLLKAAERVYDLVKGFARCLVDKRAPEKIRHTLEDLIGQRVFGIACGHPDGNDADHLAEDPIHKLLLGRDPVTGERLASPTDAVAIRERRGPGRLVPDGTGVGRERDRAAPATPTGAGAADHDRSGPDRRPDARCATAHLLQRVLRHVVLSAAAGVRDVRPRSGAVPLCGGAAARQRGRLRRSGRPVVAVAAAAALRVSTGAVPRPPRLGFCDAGGLRLPGYLPAARLRRLDAEERRPGAARRTRDEAGANAQCAQRSNRARLRRDPLCSRLLETPAACRDQGGRSSGSRAASRGTIPASS